MDYDDGDDEMPLAADDDDDDAGERGDDAAAAAYGGGDGAYADADASGLPEGAAFCSTCDAAVDDVEELGGYLICAACGGALDAPQLVHARTLRRAGDDGGGGGDGGPPEGRGVVVRASDGGALAAAVLRGGRWGRAGGGGGGSGGSAAGAVHGGGGGGGAAPDLRAHAAALASGATAARLPPAVARDAAELLPAAARALHEAGRHVMQATLAAVAYTAARNLT